LPLNFSFFFTTAVVATAVNKASNIKRVGGSGNSGTEGVGADTEETAGIVTVCVLLHSLTFVTLSHDLRYAPFRRRSEPLGVQTLTILYKTDRTWTSILIFAGESTTEDTVEYPELDQGTPLRFVSWYNDQSTRMVFQSNVIVQSVSAVGCVEEFIFN
jgi:hypothetical protein